MHWLVLSPGFRFERLNRAWPASSSASTTVPAANVLPGFAVVAVNAAFVADSTSAPQAPTATRAIRPFCRRRNQSSRRRRRVQAAAVRRPTPYHLPHLQDRLHTEGRQGRRPYETSYRRSVP